VNRRDAAARPTAPDRSGWAERHAPHRAPGTPATPASSPDDDTVPLPVILGEGPTGHTARNGRDAVAPGSGSGFPNREVDPAYRPPAVQLRTPVHGGNETLDPVRPASRPADGPRNRGSDSRQSPPAQKQAKLDQLKALYRTAGAIGEEALTKHFDQLSQHQHELIREYFEQAGLGRTGNGWASAVLTPPRG
jgi:hypothetical protein